MDTKTGTHRITLGAFVAHMLTLQEREGVKIVKVQQAGTSQRFVIDVEPYEVQSMARELAAIVEGEELRKESGEPSPFTREQRRSIAKAHDDMIELRESIAVAAVMATSGDQFVSGAGWEGPAANATPEQVAQVRDDITREYDEKFSAVIEETRQSEKALLDSLAPKTIVDRSAPRDGTTEPASVRTAREALERSELRLADAIAANAKPGTVAAFRANATRRKTAYLFALNESRQNARQAV